MLTAAEVGPGGSSCSSSFDPQALFDRMMSRNEELAGENILKRQIEDLTAECAEKDAIIESLKARLEDTGVEPSPACPKAKPDR